ncbi:MAG: site-specific DNA-methyltransferase [Acidobacteria bacterium]|nr:site-specific DNA-methyltransferase [Acidobacteriota bacterium]
MSIHTSFDTSADGLLIHGDNHDALKYLGQLGLEGKIKLVYIDPPFGTKQDFTISNERFATISRVNGGKVAYRDSLTGDDYLKFLGERLVLIRDAMADDGSIYVHIDTKMGHYVKCLMDSIFGEKNFINDITRVKCNPKNFQRCGYGNTKDVILFYSKGPGFVWNEPRQPIDIDADPRFKSVDASGRKYTTTPLHAPGETTNGATGKTWRQMLPPPGRHWRYPPEVLQKLDQQGLIEWSPTGNPRKIIYADEVAKNGAKVQDVWTFKDPQHSVYPTEKNLDMLRMIVRASSNAGDWVLDAFAGSGTTLVAAQELGRRFIGIDSSSQAIKLAKKRLSDYTLIEISKGPRHERVERKDVTSRPRRELLRQTARNLSSRAGC